MAFKTELPYVDEEVTRQDLLIATTAFGWFLGFVHWVIWAAIGQSKDKKISIYLVLVWTEILVCILFASICWAYIIGAFPPYETLLSWLSAHPLTRVYGYSSFLFFFSILTFWALQVQLLLQIIINRICLLWHEPRHKFWLKYGVAAIITAINISVYCIWVPARLQISPTYIQVNKWWDRCEKCIYLVVDLCLNILFIRTVNTRLISQGLERYRPLLNFNIRLVFVSIGMDVLIIGMMSLRNSFVYMMFHPVAYIVKLSIEMAISTLIVQIASAKRNEGTYLGYRSNALEIAVHTKVHTESQAVALEDLETGIAGKTRTPARPDLHARLNKMRADRNAKLEARKTDGQVVAAEGWHPYGPKDGHDMDEADEKLDAFVLGEDDDVGVQKRAASKVNFQGIDEP